MNLGKKDSLLQEHVDSDQAVTQDLKHTELKRQFYTPGALAQMR